MKTIKIFLASSEELKDERLEMTDLVSRLNQTFKGRGIQLELKRWEYLDSSMGDERKQDEYNKVLRECDICLVLFWRKFGSYTAEELDVAYQCHKNKVKPEKIYVFFKNPDDNDVTSELKEFIKSYENRYGGHFFNKFLNVDTLKLEFLLQFELYQKDQLGEKAIEVRNEHVYVDNEAMVDLNNIPFAANNKGFLKMQSKLKELEEEIEKQRKELDEKNTALQLAKDQQAKLPDVAGLQMFVEMAQKAVNETEDSLQVLLNQKNQLEEDFQKEQERLLNTARHMSEIRGQRITDRIARAIEAFEEGDVHRANIILEEAERDADQALADIRQTKIIGILSIDELMLKASTIMSDTTIPIDDRVEQAYQLYQKAVTIAKEINSEKTKYVTLIDKYASFLSDYAKYDEALSCYIELLTIRERILGQHHPETATTLNIIGSICRYKGEYELSLKYDIKALEIQEKVLGKEHLDTAVSYLHIGNVYFYKGDYNKALEYYLMALAIREKVLGIEHPDTANSYNNIGNVYGTKGDYDKALEYHQKALGILEKVLGKEHRRTAWSYNAIGKDYLEKGNYYKALDYLKQALRIREKVLGKEHPQTGLSYNGTAWIYHLMGKYEEALPWAEKAIAACTDNPEIIDTVATIYQGLGRYDEALEQFELCLKSQRKHNVSEERIRKTEEKMAALKEQMKSN